MWTVICDACRAVLEVKDRESDTVTRTFRTKQHAEFAMARARWYCGRCPDCQHPPPESR